MSITAHSMKSMNAELTKLGAAMGTKPYGKNPSAAPGADDYDDDPDMSIQPVPGPAPQMRKDAAFEDPKKPSTAKVLGSSLLGMGAGMGLGYGALKGIDALSRASGGKGVPPGLAHAAMPFVGGAVGLAAPLLHYATLERMREEHARKQQMGAQEAPGGRQGS